MIALIYISGVDLGDLETFLGAMVTIFDISPEPPELLPALQRLKETSDCRELLPLFDFLKEEVEREEQESAGPLAQFRLELGLKLEMFNLYFPSNTFSITFLD